MLKLEIPKQKIWDDETETFNVIPAFTLRLEHSLIAVAKWESIYERPFLDENAKPTSDEMLDYVRCMTINQTISDEDYNKIPESAFLKINNYINQKHTATTINHGKKGGPGTANNNQKITSELIYSWMFHYNIPIECEKWNIERLLMLIQVCAINEGDGKNGGKKATQQDVLKQNAALNAARRAKYGNL